ncbi:MAG: CPBP family intramembrane glutamic endopeptidase [Acutalibacteraceae bacterium]|nr:CPBP family intramembrane glutamic endopeptidase [Acutalibacteraceae bacterium]
MKNIFKSWLLASLWGLLFIGGMTAASLALIVGGVLLNIEPIVDGIYALYDFMAAIGTEGFAEAAKGLADNCAVLIHTSMCLGYLPVIIAMIVRRKEDGGFNTISKGEVPTVFKYLTISMAASFVLDVLMNICCTIPYFAQQASTLSSVAALSTAGLPWLAFLTTGILAPIVEEIAFRRGIQKNISEKYGPIIGIAVSSITFGVMHGNLFQGIFATLMGIILGYVYYKTNNLWYTTIIHIVNNSACVLISLLGLNGTVVGIAIPVVAGLLYLATKKNEVNADMLSVVQYIKANYTAES